MTISTKLGVLLSQKNEGRRSKKLLLICSYESIRVSKILGWNELQELVRNFKGVCRKKGIIKKRTIKFSNFDMSDMWSD